MLSSGFEPRLQDVGTGKSTVLWRFVYTMTKTRHFHIRLADFMNLNFFVRDKMANTNAKTPCFHHSVNEPLEFFKKWAFSASFCLF